MNISAHAPHYTFFMHTVFVRTYIVTVYFQFFPPNKYYLFRGFSSFFQKLREAPIITCKAPHRSSYEKKTELVKVLCFKPNTCCLPVEQLQGCDGKSFWRKHCFLRDYFLVEKWCCDAGWLTAGRVKPDACVDTKTLRRKCSVYYDGLSNSETWFESSRAADGSVWKQERKTSLACLLCVPRRAPFSNKKVL